MKITITATTGKGKASTEKDIDKTVEKLEKIMELMDKDFGHYNWTNAKAMSDGTSMTLEN